MERTGSQSEMLVFRRKKSGYTCIAFDQSGQPYVAYSDYPSLYGKLTVKKFDGSDWVNVGPAGFSAGLALSTSLVFSPANEPYVAYNDGGNSDKATVMKFDGTHWVNVGIAGFSAG